MSGIRTKGAGKKVAGALLLAALAAARMAAPAAAQGSLAEKLEPILARLGPHAVNSVRVVSVRTGEVLYERSPDTSMLPASNMKLITSATALAKLGPDYRFTTRVLAAGKVGPDGVLSGDLVLQGGGDPVLETPGLEELADSVQKAGVRTVTGALLADDYRFDGRRLGSGWPWDDESDYYSAQISALSVNRNVMTLEITPGRRPGDPVSARLQPVPEYARVVVDATTAEKGAENTVDVRRERARNEVRVRGSLAVDAAPLRDQEVTMEEPELFAGELFRKLLLARGVRVAGPTRRAPAPAGAEPLARHDSPPLSRIVALLNKPSDNLVAEMLLKELGFAGRRSGDAAAGRAVVEGWLRESGVETSGLRIADGSGLSRRDLVTARALTQLLLLADRQPWRDVFLESLPVAGVDGTLRRRMKGTPAEKNVRAKTGSLGYVSALSGYLTTAAGERLVFSILTNNHPGAQGAPTAKQVEDAVVSALVE